ncbi:MAG: hypothetical protein QOH81_963 [Sphingomonadales bacterium]|nr:hypothetical protein [Sphingomonadales bacterium]
MKIAICYPAHSETKAHFTLSLVGMVTHILSQRLVVNGEEVRPEIRTHMVPGNSNIARARERLAEIALEWNPDYLLCVDVDQTFPPDTFFRLATHDVSFVGCNIRKRDPDRVVSTARNFVGERTVAIEPKSEGLEPVDFVGFGVALIKAGVFTALPRPWFENGRYGEDGHFCRLAKAHGIQPYVDHGLSMEVGHIAETVLRFPGSPAA